MSTDDVPTTGDEDLDARLASFADATRLPDEAGTQEVSLDSHVAAGSDLLDELQRRLDDLGGS